MPNTSSKFRDVGSNVQTFGGWLKISLAFLNAVVIQ